MEQGPLSQGDSSKQNYQKSESQNDLLIPEKHRNRKARMSQPAKETSFEIPAMLRLPSLFEVNV
jgi:hypothetical protein